VELLVVLVVKMAFGHVMMVLNVIHRILVVDHVMLQRKSLEMCSFRARHSTIAVVSP
jgi:hypothetical protein